MKKRTSSPGSFALASAILALPAALILSQPPQLWAHSIESGIVNGKTDEGYRFMSGGVGSGERTQMQKQARDYDLDLSFADAKGHYLSDVKVAITDEHGNQIVDTTTAGPLLYVELPSGKYNVKADFNGHTEEVKNLAVSKGHLRTRLMHWQVTDQTTANAEKTKPELASK